MRLLEAMSIAPSSGIGSRYYFLEIVGILEEEYVVGFGFSRRVPFAFALEQDLLNKPLEFLAPEIHYSEDPEIEIGTVELKKLAEKLLESLPWCFGWHGTCSQTVILESVKFLQRPFVSQ
jgi:hypothetical protein